MRSVYTQILVSLFALIAGNALAQESLPPSVGLLDEIVESPFSPTVAFVLHEIGPGEVRQYKATSIELEPAENRSDPSQILALGAPIKIPGNTAEGKNFNYSFFWANESASFESSPVKSQSYADLRLGSRTTTSLDTDLLDLERDIKAKRVELVNLKDDFEVELTKNEHQAVVIEIVALKREKQILERKLEEQKEAINHFNYLLEEAREQEEPEEIDRWIKELSVDLKDAAQATAMADRLASRQKAAAMQSFSQKLEAVRSQDTESPEELAREILSIRKRRRELETRLGIPSTAEDSQAQF